MADLGYSDAQWLAFAGRRLAYLHLSPLRYLREAVDKFKLTREQATVQLTTSTYLDASVGDMTLIGAIPGVNCTNEGRFYVRFTGNSGARVVSVYSTTGGSGLVAQGTAADGAVATLAEQNSSGVSGTWPIPSSSGNTSGDELSVLAYPDFRAPLRRVLDQTDIHSDDDGHAQAVLDEVFAECAARMQSVLDFYKGQFTRTLLSDGTANPQALGNEFTGTTENALDRETIPPSTDGEISRVHDGWFPYLRDAMEDETTGSTQAVVRTQPSGGAGSFDAGNTGLGAVSAHTPDENCPPMTIRFRCVAGADTGDLGSERFEAVVTYDRDGDERASFTIATGPTIKQSWKGPNGFGPITITRTYTKTGDGSDNIFTAASNAVVTGENNTNTSLGTLWWQLEANGSNWDISFYNASTLASSALVAKATNVATSASFTAEAQNSSGLTIAWQLGGTESATNGTLLLNPFLVERSDGRRDEFSVAVTVAASPGLIQRMLGEEFNTYLNSAAAASETIGDEYAKAGSFPPFAKEDN